VFHGLLGVRDSGQPQQGGQGEKASEHFLLSREMSVRMRIPASVYGRGANSDLETACLPERMVFYPLAPERAMRKAAVTDMLCAVLAQPEDDLVRLACADWLDENGQAARAAFIRCQIALHQRPEFDPEAVDLDIRSETLLAEHERSWLGEWANQL